MATILKRIGPTGNVSFLAHVRIKGFEKACHTFKVIPDPKIPRAQAIKAARADAEDWAEKLELELRTQVSRSSGIRTDVAKLTIGGLIREYLKDPNIKELKSVKDVQRLLAWWLNQYGGEKLLDFGVLTARKAREKLNSEHAGPATSNRYLSQMRAAWNWGRESGLVPVERAWPPGLMMKEPRGRVRFLSDDEINNVLKASEPDPVMYAAILVSLSAGLRQGELLRLTWADVDLTGAKVTVRESKNDEQRAAHLTATAVAAVKALRALPVVSPVHVFVLSDGKPLKKSLLERRWDKIRTAAKLKDFRWHDLRHSCASILLQSGATLAQVGSVLGHKSPAMSLRYAHLMQGAPVTGHDKLEEKLKGKSK